MVVAVCPRHLLLGGRVLVSAAVLQARGPRRETSRIKAPGDMPGVTPASSACLGPSVLLPLSEADVITPFPGGRFRGVGSSSGIQTQAFWPKIIHSFSVSQQTWKTQVSQ